MLTIENIQQAASRMAALAHSPTRVILFGSYARGDADEGSDLDLLVIEQDIPDYTQEYLRLHRALDSLGVGVDLLILTEREFEKKRTWWTTPIYWAAKEGKVVYERK